MSAAFIKVAADLGLLDEDDSNIPKVDYSDPLITERSVDETRPLKVIFIGAGISGIVAGIKLQSLTELDLTIYEKNDDVGGTWFENRYPGVACDLPAHVYQLSFESNPGWSTFYASGSEILEYWKRVVQKYGIRRYMKFGHECVEARWKEDISKWEVKLLNLAAGEIIEDTADVFMTGLGNLNKWKLPDIKGLLDFQGEVLHTANWKASFDPSGKAIALIGSGSSAIQVLPQIQPVAKRVDHYIRSPTWISSTVRHEELMKRGNLGNFRYEEAEIKAWRDNPASYLEYRRYLEVNIQGGFRLNQRGSKENRGIRKLFEMDMKKRLEKKPEVADFLIPNFSPICKRLTPGPGYLEAVSADNVNMITTPISHIDRTGTFTEGRHHQVDAIICATGFDTTFLGTFPVYGRGGVCLQEKRRDRQASYLSIGIDEFPNFFQVVGPNGGIGNANLLIMIENIVDYITNCLRKMATQNILTMEPKKTAVENFTKYCEIFHKRTVFGEECNSWYKSAPPGASPEERRKGRVTAIWPGSSLHACKIFQQPRFEDYVMESVDKNAMSWLGDGLTVAEKVDDAKGKTYYLRDSFVQDDLPQREATNGTNSVVTQ